MNDLPLADLTAQLGIANLLTEQSISIATTYSLNLLAGILTVIIGIYISRRAGRMTRESLAKVKRIDKTLVPMIGALVRYAGLVLTIIVALGNFGVETTSIIAVLGAAGIAIGLAYLRRCGL